MSILGSSRECRFDWVGKSVNYLLGGISHNSPSWPPVKSMTCNSMYGKSTIDARQVYFHQSAPREFASGLSIHIIKGLV